MGVLEEVGFRLGLQADSYPKGTHISLGTIKGTFNRVWTSENTHGCRRWARGRATRTRREPELGPPGSG